MCIRDRYKGDMVNVAIGQGYLTVNPILIEWNKNVASRLKSFPGMNNLGLIESNGHQNYKNWDKMMSYHPRNSESWVKAKKGVYQLGRDFYENSGGTRRRTHYAPRQN